MARSDYDGPYVKLNFTTTGGDEFTIFKDHGWRADHFYAALNDPKYGGDQMSAIIDMVVGTVYESSLEDGIASIEFDIFDPGNEAAA